MQFVVRVVLSLILLAMGACGKRDGKRDGHLSTAITAIGGECIDDGHLCTETSIPDAAASEDEGGKALLNNRAQATEESQHVGFRWHAIETGVASILEFIDTPFNIIASMFKASETKEGKEGKTSSGSLIRRLVMDFDCTLSYNHLWKTTHMPSGTWREKAEEAFPMLGDPRTLPGAKEFAVWIMGGEERVAELRDWFQKLRARDVRIEISTWSEVSWVLKVLDRSELLYPTTMRTRPQDEKPFIDRIHGKDDDGRNVVVWTPEERKLDDASMGKKVKYDEITGWIAVSPQQLESKQQWLNALVSGGVAGSNKGDRVVFVDDTAENYRGLNSNVFVFDNEEYGLEKDGSGLDANMMKELLKITQI